MDLEKVLYVFSTQRLIRDFYAKKPQGLMPKALSIGEFFKKSYIVPDKTRINHRIQTIILQNILRQIIAQKPKITNLLVFEKSFLGYLEGSDFLVYLFNEIKHHNITFSDIPSSDIYADFTEHLAIIEEIFTSFEEVLEKERFFSIPRKDEIIIIDEFINAFKKIEIFIDGFLTPIEVHILEQIALKTPLHIHLNIDSYNATHFPYFTQILQDTQKLSKNPNQSIKQALLEPNFSYCIEMQKATQESINQTQDFAQNLNTKHINPQNLSCKITQKIPLKNLPHISSLGFELRIGQCSFVLERVRELLESGVDGEQIAIVLPSDDMVEYFEILDEARNLNYAMGKENLGLFATLESLLQNHAKKSIQDDLQNNAQNTQKSTIKTDIKDNLSALESILQSSQIYSQISPNLTKSIQEILLQYTQIKSYINALEWQELSMLFLEDLERLKDDDTRGGKVRVMGILETRGLSCEYVFVLDCNEDFIPKVKDSDMFLNTFIRTQLAMPTLKDREHLQKHYYYSLFLQTRKEVYLTHTQNDERTRANLLDELHIKSQNGDDCYALFPDKKLPVFVDENAFGSLENFRFSATSLWTFVECKRKFYFQYVLKIAPQEEKNLSLNIGTNLHNALLEAYNKYKNIPLNPQILESIKQDFMTKSKQILQPNDLEQNLSDISYMEILAYQMSELEMSGFWEYEAKRVRENMGIANDKGDNVVDFKNFEDLENKTDFASFFSDTKKESSLRVIECECDIESSILHNGKRFMLKGRIDRLDMDSQGKLWILDYKYAKNKKNQAKYKFQLAFYKILLESKILEYGNLGFLGKEYEGYALKNNSANEEVQNLVEAGLYFLKEKQNVFLHYKNSNQKSTQKSSQETCKETFAESNDDKTKNMILQALQDSAGDTNRANSKAQNGTENTKNNQVDFALTDKLSTCRNCPYIWLCNRA
ncbi:PD-(D/E)XK nuclease family protein [Helicobacter sp. T3_23-1059]